MEVTDGGDELTDEGTRTGFTETTPILVLDVSQQLTAGRELSHEAVEGGSLRRAYAVHPT